MKIKKEFISSYLEDSSGVEGAYADEVAIPESINEISEYLKDCHRKNVKVTVSGGRTGLVAGALSFGGFLLSMELLKKKVSRVLLMSYMLSISTINRILLLKI